MAKKTPMRKCVLSGKMKPKKDMVRIVRNPDKSVAIDPTGKKNGRGAYVSMDLQLLESMKKSAKLSQALNTEVPAEFFEELIDHVDYKLARMELLNDQ